MTARKQKILIVMGVGLIASGIAMMYIPLALVFLGSAAVIEVLTSKPQPTGSDK
jgi:hypothetical protein